MPWRIPCAESQDIAQTAFHTNPLACGLSRGLPRQCGGIQSQSALILAGHAVRESPSCTTAFCR